jgi:hypothetical protein
MTQEQINNNNVLIADFIGLKKGMLGEYTNPLDKPSKDGYVPIYSPDGSDMKFNSDWNWIMIAIDKIEAKGYRTCIEYFGEHRVYFSHDSVGERDSNKITATYKAVIQFIEWYNKHK